VIRAATNNYSIDKNKTTNALTKSPIHTEEKEAL
jgi:hypothetical protein